MLKKTMMRKGRQDTPMDTLQILALQRWSELTNEGVLAVEKSGHILILNSKLRERLALQIPAQNVKALLSQATKHAPDLKRLLVDLNSPRTEWGSLQIVGQPARQMLWERTPLQIGDEVVGALFIFRDAVSEGQRELAKQSFLSMISHDLRTPLSTILGFAELLYNTQETSSREEQAEFLQYIINSATQLSKHIKIALDVMYLEADLKNFETEVVSLQRILEHWSADASHRLCVQRLAFHNGTEADLLAHASPEALHQIMDIMVEFAQTEAPENDTIQIHLSQDGLYAHVFVEHRAPGLHREDIPNLFRITYPRDLSDEGRPKLHRMQLYVAHLLAERQQGHLTIHEREGQKYTLDLAVPLAKAVNITTPENK